MKRSDYPVTEDDVGNGPCARPGLCFQCAVPVGEQHAADCIKRQRTVVVEVKITMVREVPEDWPAEMINFHMNESSWCADNLLPELNAHQARTDAGKVGCLCAWTEATFVREATAEDVAGWLGPDPTVTAITEADRCDSK